jgi:hypothetical protein
VTNNLKLKAALMEINEKIAIVDRKVEQVRKDLCVTICALGLIDDPRTVKTFVRRVADAMDFITEAEKKQEVIKKREKN